MIQENHQTQQDNNMLDCECDFISTDQHAYQQETVLSKWAQILWVVSWRLLSHTVFQVSEIQTHDLNLLSESKVWSLYNIRPWQL